MPCYQRSMKISYRDQITNEMVLERYDQNRKLLPMVKSHKLKYSGHTSSRDVTEPAKIRIRRMRISCAKSVGFGCGFVAQSKLPAIIATAIELSYLKLNSYKQTSSE